MVRFRACQSALHHVLQGAPPDDLPELATGRLLRRQPQKLNAAFVGKENVLLGVERDHSFDHAAQNHAQLLAVFLEQGDLLSQMLAHLVEGANQLAAFVRAVVIDFEAVRTGRQAFRAALSSCKASAIRRARHIISASDASPHPKLMAPSKNQGGGTCWASKKPITAKEMAVRLPQMPKKRQNIIQMLAGSRASG